jgi:pimeloyl-ACP methyl ester carboxylesterase
VIVGFIWTIIIILWLLLTWLLYVKWHILSNSYVLTSVHLFVSIFLFFISGISLFRLENIIWNAAGSIAYFLSLLFVLLFLTKAIFLHSSHSLDQRNYFRTNITIDPYPIPFEFSPSLGGPKQLPLRDHMEREITTDDNVKIRLTHIIAGHSRVIIIAHGAFRQRKTAPYVIIAQWLAYKYDVVLFDFRGHGESGGYFNFDDATILDLKAVIDYSKREGYKKIGVFSRSMGAWTTLLEVAKYQNIDSVIAAASPLGQILDISLAKRFHNISEIPFFGSLVFPVGQVIISLIKNTRISGLHYASQCPIEITNHLKQIPVFLIYHEEDPVIELKASDAKKLFEELRGKKELLILAGRGHIFEIQQFYFLYRSIEDWFSQTLG